MSKPGHHTVLPEWHLRLYFGAGGFQNYDLQDRKWKSVGPRSFGKFKAYYEDEIESELGKIESDARNPVIKLAQRCELNDEERQQVAWYIAASLFRNSSMFDELLPEVLENFKHDLYLEYSAEPTGLVERAVDAYVDQLTSDQGFKRGMHGAWFEHAEQYPMIAENIYGLTWHILYVARKPNYFLLTDRPFRVHAPTDATQAAFTFPISSEVMLIINNEPHEKWIVQSVEREHVLDFGRGLVARAKRFVAAPREDAKITKMIERIRPVGSHPAK